MTFHGCRINVKNNTNDAAADFICGQSSNAVSAENRNFSTE